MVIKLLNTPNIYLTFKLKRQVLQEIIMMHCFLVLLILLIIISKFNINDLGVDESENMSGDASFRLIGLVNTGLITASESKNMQVEFIC